MRLAGLHSLCGYAPDGRAKVDLVPPCPTNLAGARGGKDREFKRLGSRIFLLGVQPLNKSPNGRDRQRGLVCPLGDLFGCS